MENLYMKELFSVTMKRSVTTVHHCHAIEFDLDAFMKNFEKSQSDLKWIRDESHKNEGKEIESADSSSFDEDDENSVDHWYNKYRKWECATDHGNQEPKVLNGYCGVYDDSHPKFVQPNNVENAPASDHKVDSNLKDTKFEFIDTDSMTDNFDNFHENFDQEHFDMDSDTKLSAEEKLDLEEYNEQMIPNPNFYKINNELHVNDQQIIKDHNAYRNELGFSSALSKYPSSTADDIYNRIDNDFGNENNVDGQDIKTKRNTEDFDAMPKTNFDEFSYNSHLNDQDDNTKNDLSHEADYKLSKTEQESSQNKLKPTNNKQTSHESRIGQKIQNEPKNRFGNEFRNSVPNNLQNEHSSGTLTHYNNFKEINEPLTDFNKNSRPTTSNSKANVYPAKQSTDSKSQKYVSQHVKTNQLANEINLKISNRMMSKGLGPSLPSRSVKYSQRAYRHHPMNVDVENQQHWRNGRSENSDDSTDFIGMQRRLLQFDYDDPLIDYPLHNEKRSPKSEFFQTLNAKTPVSNGEIVKTTVTNASETIHPKAMETTPENTKKDKLDQIKIEATTKANQTETNQTLQADHVDAVKLQLEMKISNASTKIQPTGDHGKIVKRSPAYGKQFGLQETKIQGISKNSSIRDLVSGKLPNQLIQAVFQLVKENSRLNKVVGSKLDMKIVDNLELNSINLFKSKQKTEKMVKKLMSSITDLIDEQITHQTCISLPSDLQSFYDKVIYVRLINSRVNKMRKQNKGGAGESKNSTKRITRSAIPDSDLHQKYKTVGKLLKQFGHLKLRDQVKIFDIKEFLQNHVQLLDDLKALNSEFVRKSRSVQSNKSGRDSQNVKLLALDKGSSHISRQYANLLKTTKLIKTTSLTDMDGMDVISTYR